jgi:hypothetical protein
VPVIALRDNPRFTVAPSSCLAQLSATRTGAERCAVPVETVLDPRSYDSFFPIPLAEDPQLVTMDLSEQFCLNGLCQAEIGGVVVYLDANHLPAPMSSRWPRSSTRRSLRRSPRHRRRPPPAPHLMAASPDRPAERTPCPHA